MTDKNINIKNKDNEPLGLLAIHLLSNIPVIITSLISLITVAYITGWIQARAYFSKFDAEWLVSELSSYHLLQFSWLPLVYLGFFIFLGIQDLEDTENDKRFRRWSATAKVLKYSLIPLLVLVSFSNYLSYHHKTVALGLSSVSFIACVFYAGAAFEGLLITARLKRLTWESADLKLLAAIIIFGLYFSPQQLGLLNGLVDTNSKLSRCPIVETINPYEKELRLLLISGDKVYTYQAIRTPSEPNKIGLFSIYQVKTIFRPKAEGK